MLLKPCFRCPQKDGCELRDDLRRRPTPVTITVATIKCSIYRNLFRLGQRVTATFIAIIGYGPESERYGDVTIGGTVVGFKAQKFVVWLDEPIDAEGNRRIVKLWPNHPGLKASDEPDMKLCPKCNKPDGREHVQDWHCGLCGKTATEGK